MAWGLGVDGRAAEGLQSPHRVRKALFGSCGVGWRELSPGPTVAHPPHRLTQEVGGTTVQISVEKTGGKEAAEGIEGCGIGHGMAAVILNDVRPAFGEERDLGIAEASHLLV